MSELTLVVIGAVAFGASLLTFFSGFGLSTLLTPVMVVFFPLDLAIAITALIHFLNNLFKIGLTANAINWPVVLKFGLPAIPAAFIGAKLLTSMGNDQVIFTYQILNVTAEVQPIKLLIALLMVVFALFELLPKLKAIQFGKNKIIIGGVLSGFFGGLSGHQGALRSLFLLRFGLSKEAFIASGIMIATFIDISRISVYSTKINPDLIFAEWQEVLVAVLAAFAGAFLGKRLLKKVTLNFIQNTVSGLIIALACLLALGLL